MSDNVKGNFSALLPSQDVMRGRYQCAQSLLQGMFTKKIACNATVYPIWIGDSDCFWYERESKEGKEYRFVDAKVKNNIIAFDHVALASLLAAEVQRDIDSVDLPICDTV